MLLLRTIIISVESRERMKKGAIVEGGRFHWVLSALTGLLRGRALVSEIEETFICVCACMQTIECWRDEHYR